MKSYFLDYFLAPRPTYDPKAVGINNNIDTAYYPLAVDKFLVFHPLSTIVSLRLINFLLLSLYEIVFPGLLFVSSILYQIILLKVKEKQIFFWSPRISFTAGAGTRCLSLLSPPPSHSGDVSIFGLQDDRIFGLQDDRMLAVGCGPWILLAFLWLLWTIVHKDIDGENPKGNKEIWESREVS